MENLTALITAIANDRESGASEILDRAITVLRRVIPRGAEDRLETARAVCGAQPGMAPIWNAALAVLSEEQQPGQFERFVQRLERAPAALTRVTRELFSQPDTPTKTGVLSLITISSSASVRRAVESLASMRSVRIACAEGRPALEGRRTAAALAKAGAAVTLFSDAAIADALHDADAILVGGDAIASDWFMNKVGTRLLAAAAALVGVPLYVIASRDKFCAPALEAFIKPRDGSTGEIWDTPPPGVVVRNPYFEKVSMNLVTAVVTDGGVMPAANVAQFCESFESAATANLLKRLALG